MSVYLSELDFNRFAVKTAQARIATSEEAADLAQFCQSNAVELSIVRVPSSQLSIVQELESDGYRLMDCLVYYAFKFGKKDIPNELKHQTRPILETEREQLVAIAEESFKGYFGHYHADPRLPNDKCDEVYIDWAANSLMKKELQHHVIGTDDNGKLNSFLSFKVNNPDEVEVMLSGILQYAQRQGIHQSLMVAASLWAKNFGAQQIVVSTQVTNVASQKAWIRLGFEPSESYYTLHKWF